MEKRLFIAAAFVAAFVTGCGPNQGIDAGPLPDTGMPVDAGPDPVDAWVDPMVDAYVPPGDSGMDAGTIVSSCEDPEYVGLECNLPFGMVYTRTEFTCADYINRDRWMCDTCSAPEGEGTREEGGVLYSYLRFARANTGLYMPTGTTMEFTCGPEGRCWLNWFNPDSSYSHCRVSFSADCFDATTECWPPGSSDPVTSYAVYIGPST